MTAREYIQMKAFARNDGLALFLLWLASFICYVQGLRFALLGMIALLLALMTPFTMMRRLRGYRDKVLEGFISFRRGWAYTMFVFFYAGLLFAIAQFVYFNYMDHGYFFDTLNEMMSEAENMKGASMLGLDTMNQTLQQMSQMRPIDLVLNVLTTNLLIGMVLGVPIAAIAKRSPLEKVN